jgi:hypothetical protein
MDMPKPTDAHIKLEKLLGNWKGEEKLNPSPWDTKGGPATGKENNRSSLDGFVVIQEYEQIRNGVPTFKGHGVFTYDPYQKCYCMHWFDSMGAPVNEFKGNFENNILTMTHQGKMGHSRAIMDFSKDGVYKFKMDGSQDGKQWVPFMEGSYTKG